MTLARLVTRNAVMSPQRLLESLLERHRLLPYPRTEVLFQTTKACKRILSVHTDVVLNDYIDPTQRDKKIRELRQEEVADPECVQSAMRCIQSVGGRPVIDAHMRAVSRGSGAH